MENIFEKIKKDLKKGLDEGIAAVVQGANVVSVKMNELSDEGKKQYKMFNIYVKIKDHKNELGELAYTLLEGGKSLDTDKKVKTVYNKIKKLEWQLSKPKGDKKIAAAPKKAATKAVKKISAKK